MLGHMLGERHRLVDRQRLGQRLGRLRRAHAVDRVAGHRPLLAPPAVQAAPGRQHDGHAARRQAVPCSCAAQRRTWCVCTARNSTPAAGAAAGQALQRLAVDRQRARRQPALDLEVLQVAQQLGRQRSGGGVRHVDQAARQQPRQRRRWRSRRCAAGNRCPCRRCSGSGRASRAPAGRRPRRRCRGAAAPSPSTPRWPDRRASARPRSRRSTPQ